MQATSCSSGGDPCPAQGVEGTNAPCEWCCCVKRQVASAPHHPLQEVNRAGLLQDRKPSPLERGGSLKGEKAAGKVYTPISISQLASYSQYGHRSLKPTLLVQDAGTSATSALQKQKGGPVQSIKDGSFSDYRWKDGRWDLSLFAGRDNKVDWDSVRS